MGHFLGKAEDMACNFTKKNLSIAATSITEFETLFASLTLVELQNFSVIRVASIKSSEFSVRVT